MEARQCLHLFGIKDGIEHIRVGLERPGLAPTSEGLVNECRERRQIQSLLDKIGQSTIQKGTAGRHVFLPLVMSIFLQCIHLGNAFLRIVAWIPQLDAITVVKHNLIRRGALDNIQTIITGRLGPIGAVSEQIFVHLLEQEQRGTALVAEGTVVSWHGHVERAASSAEHVARILL